MDWTTHRVATMAITLVLLAATPSFGEPPAGSSGGHTAEMVCEPRLAEMAEGQAEAPPTLLAQRPPNIPKVCSITCSQGTHTIDCQPPRVCDCICRSSGVPGCSCHGS